MTFRHLINVDNPPDIYKEQLSLLWISTCSLCALFVLEERGLLLHINLFLGIKSPLCSFILLCSLIKSHVMVFLPSIRIFGTFFITSIRKEFDKNLLSSEISSIILTTFSTFSRVFAVEGRSDFGFPTSSLLIFFLSTQIQICTTNCLFICQNFQVLLGIWC